MQPRVGFRQLAGVTQRCTPASQDTWDADTPFILYCPSAGCATRVLCTNAEFAFTAAFPGEKDITGYITAGLGKEEKKSLRSTRWCCERTDTQCSIQRNLCSCWLLLSGVLGPDTSGSEADRCIWSHLGEKGGENSGEFIWMTWWVAPHTA